jgi:outer membrane protein OmpA-like peptidoglycan-associated protein
MHAKTLFFILSLLISSASRAQNNYELVKYPDLPESITIFDMHLKKDGSVYLGTDKGLYYINSFEEAAKRIFTGMQVTALASGPKQNLLYYGGGSQFGNTEDFVEHNLDDPTASVTDMLVSNNFLWIGTDKGLYKYSLKNLDSYRKYTSGNSKLVSDHINFLYEDNYGILWVGTKRGVVRIDNDRWKAWEKQSMESVYENKEGLWLLAESSLWNIENMNKRNRWNDAALQDGLKKGKVNAIAIDSEDRLLIASELLIRFSPYTGKIERYGQELGLISEKCLSLAVDEDDKIWIGTEGNGLYTVGFKARKAIEKSELPMEIVLTGKSPSCAEYSDGSIRLSIKNGNPPFRVNWSTGAKDLQQIFGLKSGQYRVTVTDSDDKAIESRVQLSDPAKLELVLEELSEEATASRMSARFSFAGGTPGYVLEVDGETSPNPSAGLGKGKHTAVLTDVMGCKSTLSFDVEIESDQMALQIDKIEVGHTIRIDQLFFLPDSTNILPASIPVLNEVFDFLNANPKIIIEIGGHTNSLPPDDYCDRLSFERAKSVYEYLMNKGIEPKRVSYRGYGKRNPIATNATVEGRRRNQRVELKILSLGE